MNLDWMKSDDNPLTLIIMRGIPASGKSYRAKELSGGDDSVIFSADYYYGRTKEEYVKNWNPAKIGLAHESCQAGVRKAMQDRCPLVIVDNTNTMVREMTPYFRMAVQYGYKVRIEEPTSPWWLNDIAPYLTDKVKYKAELDKAAEFLTEKSKETHCVPLEAIQRMLGRYVPNVTFD